MFATVSRAAVLTCAAISSVTLVLLALIGTVDVIGTWLLNAPVPAAREISSELLSILIFFAFGYAQLKREHVAVDLIYVRFPSRLRALVDGLALVIGLVLFATMTWRFTLSALDSFAIKETAAALVTYPIFPFKAAVAIASLVATLEYLNQLVLLATTPYRGVQAGEAAERSL